MKSAMILAAGRGERMRPLTESVPKSLLEVAGKTMLERALDHIKSLDVSRIVVNAHYLAPLVIEKVKSLAPNAIVSFEETLLETGGGIKHALPLLGENSFFVLNGDMVFHNSQSLKDMEKLWDDTKMDALLLLLPKEKAHGYVGRGDFLRNPSGQLLRVTKESGDAYVYIGVQLIHPRLFKDVSETSFSMNILWDKALAKGRLYGCVHQGEWFHISTPQDLIQYSPQISDLDKKAN